MSSNDGMIRQEIIDLAKDGPLSYNVYKTLMLNTYERNYLLEFLDTDALIRVCISSISNVTTRYDSTYEMTIVHKLFPIVVSRLQETLTY